MPLLDPNQVRYYSSAERTAPLPLKLEAAAALIAEILRLHDPAFRVVPFLDPRVMESRMDRRSRTEFMGDPVRYAELTWTGRGEPYDPGVSIAHRLRVLVYYGVGLDNGSATREPQTATEAQAVVDGWLAAMEAEGVWDGSSWTEPPGLLVALDRQDTLSYTDDAGDTWRITLDVSEVQAALAQPNGTNPQDARYECVFTLTLT